MVYLAGIRATVETRLPRARITISIHICSGALYLHTRHKGGRVVLDREATQVYVWWMAGYLTYVYQPPSRVHWHASLYWLVDEGDTVDIRRELCNPPVMATSSIPLPPFTPRAPFSPASHRRADLSLSLRISQRRRERLIIIWGSSLVSLIEIFQIWECLV